MASSATRYEIVHEALTRAGRDIGLRSLAEKNLNRMLRKWAFEYKYPILRKVGEVQTLGTGAQTLALPSDFGAGADSLLVGSSRHPIYERSMDEFVTAGGLPSENVATGIPTAYFCDKQANIFRFNRQADQNYAIVPVYFSVPADITLGGDGDNQKVWMEDDELVIQGLIQSIYQYTGDTREAQQFQLVQALKGDYRRGSVPVGGGVNKVMLSRRTFRRSAR